MENKEANIELQESGLVCDNPNCDWEDKTITFEFCKEWINKPCPKCGDNLLTEQDYNNAKAVHATVDFINTLSGADLEKMAEIAKQLNPEAFTQPDTCTDSALMGTLCVGGKVNITIDTHKEIRIVDINPGS